MIRVNYLGKLLFLNKNKLGSTISSFNKLSNNATAANSSNESTHDSTSNQSNEKHKTNFGFEHVKEEEKQEKVNQVFDNVASKYDIMNDAMSFGMHRIWKNTFIKEIAPTNHMKLMDVAGGTGDIAFRFLNHLKYSNTQTNATNDGEDQIKVTVCDINQNMLNVGQQRSIKMGFNQNIRWQQGNAENLSTEKSDSYDVYTIAFGIRNCTNLENVVKEAHRLLKPGGRFMCLEFSQTTNPEFTRIYDYYSFNIIPAMGYLIAGDWKSYKYLVESIRVFPNQKDFADLISRCGFKNVTYTNLTNGIVAIHSGFKI